MEEEQATVASSETQQDETGAKTPQKDIKAEKKQASVLPDQVPPAPKQDEKTALTAEEWREYARKWEQRAKENYTGQKQLEQLEKENATLKAEALRAKKVKELAHGDARLEELLDGYGTKSLEAFAEQLQKTLPEQARPVVDQAGLHAEQIAAAGDVRRDFVRGFFGD